MEKTRITIGTKFKAPKPRPVLKEVGAKLAPRGPIAAENLIPKSCGQHLRAEATALPAKINYDRVASNLNVLAAPSSFYVSNK